LAAGLGIIWLPLAGLVNAGTTIIINLFLGLVQLFQQLPGAVIYLATPPVLLAFAWYGGLLYAAGISYTEPGSQTRQRWKSWAPAGAALVLIVFMIWWPWPGGHKLAVHFIDVGQGDSILVQTPGGKNMLIDTGGRREEYQTGTGAGDQVVAPYLRKIGVNRLDVLVNNAGIATTTPKTSFLEKGMDEWRKIVDVDLIGVAGIVYEFAPHMIKAGRGGEIINITSIGAVSVSGCKGHHNAAYNAAKAGGDILTRYLAIVLGDHGIRVNAIRPGPHHSDLEVHLSDYMRNLIDNEMPCHRFGEPIELGAFCVYLSSPAAVHITGCNMNFDGGMLCVK
jgi:NAD(P)-dependent dehydrogenase (short-subunit alcohol dehydrogenase family)